MSTALVLYRRWEVADPVLDCAIEICDRLSYGWITEPNPDYEPIPIECWPTTTSDAMFFLWHAADHLKESGMMGYVWVDEPRMLANDVLTRLGNICMHEAEIVRILRGEKRV